MNDRSDINEYDILLEIFRFIRDYSTSAYSLKDVCNLLNKYLHSRGYNSSIIDYNHRGYRIFQVENHRYQIIEYENWSTYDVKLIA